MPGLEELRYDGALGAPRDHRASRVRWSTLLPTCLCQLLSSASCLPVSHLLWILARRLLAALLCTAAVIGDVVCYVPDEIDSDTFELVD